MVNKCIESLEKLVNLKTSADRALYVGSIEKLQLAVCTEGEIPAFCLLIIFSYLSSSIATECRMRKLLRMLYYLNTALPLERQQHILQKLYLTR